MKKIFSLIIISLFFYFPGCYSTHELTKQEFKNLSDSGEIILQTKEPRTYILQSDFYLIKNDTIFVMEGTKTLDLWKGSKLIKNGTTVPFSGKILLDDVDNFNLKEMDILATVGVVLVFLGSLFAIYASNFHY